MRIGLSLVLILLSLSPVMAEESVEQVPAEKTKPCGQDAGWFMGAGFGSAEVEVVGHDRSTQVTKNLTKLGYTVQNSIGSEDDNSSSLSLRGGYRFCKYLAVEGAWLDLGETDGNFAATVLNPGSTTVSGTLESEYWAVSLAALGRYPIKPWLGVYTKLGVHYWDHELEMVGQGTGINVDITEKSDGIDFFYGFGVECGPFTDVSVLRNTSLRLEWERFYGIEDEDGIDSTTVVVQYNF